MTNFQKQLIYNTNFSMKANLSETETNWIKFWKEKIYKSLKDKRKKQKLYFT